MALQYDVKLGSIGDFHIGLVGTQLMVGVDAGVDLKAQLDALAMAHQTGVLGELLKLAAAYAASLAPAAAAPAAPAS